MASAGVSLSWEEKQGSIREEWNGYRRVCIINIVSIGHFTLCSPGGPLRLLPKESEEDPGKATALTIRPSLFCFRVYDNYQKIGSLS